MKRFFDEQAPEARAIDEQIALQLAIAVQPQCVDIPGFAVEPNLDHLAFHMLDAGKDGPALEIPRDELRIEVQRVVEEKAAAVGVPGGNAKLPGTREL
jgi:hypothetical protein